MKNTHSNISVFVPHIGCPNKCSFCDQRYITGTCKAPHPEDVEAAVKAALTSKNYDPKTTEIAFFGGSFTAINRGYMETLLETAADYVNVGIVSGIRISTRPDAIDDEILMLLKSYGVTAIELGAQSLNDRVLKMNNRGHTARDVEKAAMLIKKHGFELGLQIMTGLYMDDNDSALRTVQRVIEIAPDTVRIYPTIVLKGTDLEALYLDNIYQPQSLGDAVKLASKLYLKLTRAGIRVIRLGLHSIEEGSYVAGPWHPAFAELCYSQIMLTKVLGCLFTEGQYVIFVNPKCISKMTGQRKSNLLYLKKRGFDCKVMPDASIDELDFRIEREVL